jgi:hypothetical protein
MLVTALNPHIGYEQAAQILLLAIRTPFIRRPCASYFPAQNWCFRDCGR